jgi:transposase
MPREWLDWCELFLTNPLKWKVIPMKKSRAYRTVKIKNVRLESLLNLRERQRVIFGLDVSKGSIVAMLRWESGETERAWATKNPLEVRRFAEMVALVAARHEVEVAMEPTGTYGDPLRQVLADLGIVVERVSPKASHDYAEIFDGVPSQHDGKDAAIVAELAALGKASVWEFAPSEWEEQLARQVAWMEIGRQQLTMWCGRLEGLLARHWPEATQLAKLTSGVLLRCLVEYGGPRGLADDDQAAEKIGRWSRGKWSGEKIQTWVSLAQNSVGLRQSAVSVEQIKQYAGEALACRQKISQSRKTLTGLAKGHEILARQAQAVGLVTACVLWTKLGDPRKYDSGPAYRKAMGLNLKERSSGLWVGRLKISKRGPGSVRRWLYFAALRLIRRDSAKRFYESRKQKGGDAATMKAIIGVMRKLALALYRVSVSESEFHAEKLFPGACHPLPQSMAASLR